MSLLHYKLQEHKNINTVSVMNSNTKNRCTQKYPPFQAGPPGIIYTERKQFPGIQFSNYRSWINGNFRLSTSKGI